MAKVKIGVVVPQSQGMYDATRDYLALDRVQSGVNLYDAKKNVPAGTPLTNTEYWALVLDNSAMASAEAARQTAEGQRVSAEEVRKTDEAARVKAEDARRTAETARVSAENARATAESGRVSAESTRATQEAARQTAEGQRVAAENARQTAEEQRQTASATAVENANAATTAANTAAEGAREAKADADAAALAANTAATNAATSSVQTVAQELTDEQQARARRNIGAQAAEGTLELIESIIVGYSLTTAQPDDWATNWTAYFVNTGTAREPVYTALTGSSAPTWEAGTYYAYDSAGVATIERTAEPDGTAYDLTAFALLAKFSAAATAGSSVSIALISQDNSYVAYSGVESVIGASTAKTLNYIAENRNGLCVPQWHSSHSQLSSTVYSRTRYNFDIFKPIAKWNMSAPTSGGIIPSGSVIDIWGVRANA